MSDLSKGRNSAKLSIIPFHSQHYSALAELLTESYSDHHFDREGLRALDENLPAHCKFRRWMVFCEDICVAFGEYRQTPEMYHPHRFILNIVVKPDHRIRGIGTRLYAHIVSELEIFQPTVLRATLRADSADSIDFLEKRQYSCVLRIGEWRLDLKTFGAVDSVSKIITEQTLGIDIRTVEDLRTDPQRDRKLYDLISLLRSDVPLPETPAKIDFAQFVTNFLGHPSYEPDAAFVAVKEGEYIGYSDLREDGAGDLYGGLTGVRREYRRQGVATALKLRGIRYGRLLGCRYIKTFSALENVSIGATNRKCGFVPQCAWMHFEQICSHQYEAADEASRTLNQSE